MSKVRVNCFAISLDGFGAGADQSLENPLGLGGAALHKWFYPTATFQEMLGNDGGLAGIDNDFARRGMENLGSWILGRNMFSPTRGPWTDENWKGWWGDTPPYHCEVFILTHHARSPIKMKGGTTFHFVTDGIQSALDKAKAAAKGKDIRIGGGVNTIRQYLEAGLIDEMHIAVSPVLLGKGEHLMNGIDLSVLGFRQVDYVGTEKAAHYALAKKPV